MASQYAFLLITCLLGSSLAKPANVFLGYQDSLGQYSFGYSAPGSARSEVRTLNGATRGAYSYVDGSGQVQSAQYIADGEHGFRVVATNLPEAPLPVEDTPEVVAARAAHLQALQEAESNQAALERKIEIEGSADAKIEEKEILVEAENGKDEILSKSLPENDPKIEDVDQKIENVDQKIEERDPKDVEQKIQKDVDPKIADAPAGSEAVEGIAAKSSQAVFNSHVVPVIAAPLVVPQIVGQPAVPIFRVAQGEQEIEPSSVEETVNAQASESGTPAGTALKSGENPSRRAQEDPKVREEKGQSFRTIVAPINVIPISSSYSGFVRYAPPLRYITYTYL